MTPQRLEEIRAAAIARTAQNERNADADAAPWEIILELLRAIDSGALPR